MDPLSLRKAVTKVSLFSEENVDELVEALSDCEIRNFQTGQYIFREGEYSEVCNITLSGEIKIELPRKGSGREKSFVLKEGEIFGEIAALSGTPRMADIITLKPTAILEISKEKIFDLLDRFPSVKKKIDDIYRKRVLVNLLMTIPIFSGIPDNFLEELVAEVKLETYDSNNVIFRQDDKADAFYLVRYGFVKVHKKVNDKEIVLAYLKEGHYFGEIALLSDDEKRSATVTAINRVEVVKISNDAFQKLMATHPIVRRNIENVIERRKDRGDKIQSSTHLSDTIQSSIDIGLIYGKSILIIDNTLCVQCDSCEKACASLHNGVSRITRKGKIFNKFILVPTSCRHCQDPTCMSQCPTGAITRDLSGEIYHKDFCIGCGSCARNCPWGNISIVTLPGNGQERGLHKKLTGFPERSSQSSPGNSDKDRSKTLKKARIRKKAVKCDMCRDYSFIGCVYNCPLGAARRVDAATYFSDISSVG